MALTQDGFGTVFDSLCRLPEEQAAKMFQATPVAPIARDRGTRCRQARFPRPADPRRGRHRPPAPRHLRDCLENGRDRSPQRSLCHGPSVIMVDDWRTTVGFEWTATRLHMEHPGSVNRLMCNLKHDRNPGKGVNELKKLLRFADQSQG